VDPERNLLVLEGAVPGGRGGLLEITVPSVPMGRARRDAKRKTA
jgi:ribosomal protein L3